MHPGASLVIDGEDIIIEGPLEVSLHTSMVELSVMSTNRLVVVRLQVADMVGCSQQIITIAYK
jgi:hypothetical protein